MTPGPAGVPAQWGASDNIAPVPELPRVSKEF